MGGKSSSSTTSNTTNEVDNRVFNLEGTSGNILTDIEAGGDVTFTDHGAIAGAFDLGSEAINATHEFATSALSGTQELAANFAAKQQIANTQSLEQLKGFAETLQTGGQLAVSEAMKWVALAVVAGAVIIGVKKK